RVGGVPHGGHRRAVGRARPHGRLRRRLFLSVLPEGGLPSDRSGRRSLVVTSPVGSMPDGGLPFLALGVVLAYLVGAIPVGFIVARAFGIGDIRRHGSGTIGMTNVLRTAGPAPAVLTLVGDVLKGMLAVWLGGVVAGGAVVVAAAAAAAVVGN